MGLQSFVYTNLCGWRTLKSICHPLPIWWRTIDIPWVPGQGGVEPVPAGLQVGRVVIVHFLETDGAAVVFRVGTGTNYTPIHDVDHFLACFIGQF